MFTNYEYTIKQKIFQVFLKKYFIYTQKMLTYCLYYGKIVKPPIEGLYILYISSGFTRPFSSES